MSEEIIYSNILSKVSCTSSEDCPWWIKSALDSPCAQRGETIYGPYASSTEAADAIGDGNNNYQPCGWTPIQGNCVDNECVQP
jgi:hypothetical protein